MITTLKFPCHLSFVSASFMCEGMAIANVLIQTTGCSKKTDRESENLLDNVRESSRLYIIFIIFSLKTFKELSESIIHEQLLNNLRYGLKEMWLIRPKMPGQWTDGL